MLNLDHPQSAAILEAARIEDRIRVLLLDWQQTGTLAGRSALLTLWLPELHRLNERHFEADPGISRTLEALADAVRDTDAQVAWARFLALAEHPGDNFGTWAI